MVPRLIFSNQKTNRKDFLHVVYILSSSVEPEIIYNYFANGGIGDLILDECFLETPLGEGKVDFDNYLKALESVGYKGYLTIERKTGSDPLGRY